MTNPIYTLYSVNKNTNTFVKIDEGGRGDMGRAMNQARHTAPKEHRYAIYQGKNFVASTNN